MEKCYFMVGYWRIEDSMFIIGEAHVDDEVFHASFCCDLKSCKGACCCIEGGRGAPLEDHEVLEIERALSSVVQYLSPKSLHAIELQGLYEGQPGDVATTCAEGRECVFVYYDEGIARCSFERAYEEGKTCWRKPLSCHLFPLRIRHLGRDHVVYEQISECEPGRVSGILERTKLHEFLKEPLIRKFGEEWYDSLVKNCHEPTIRNTV